jgi:hypothetical protein
VFVPAHALAERKAARIWSSSCHKEAATSNAGGRNAGLSGFANTKACSGANVYLLLLRSNSTYPPATCPLSHSRTERSLVAVRSASSSEPTRPFSHGPIKAELVPEVGHDASNRGCEIRYHLSANCSIFCCMSSAVRFVLVLSIADLLPLTLLLLNLACK